ncbi:MAG: hypothetical protein ACXVYW_14935 [Oryzihumus sp.]
MITLIVLAGGGVVGGKAIWAATAVRRLCALQGSDIEAATGVTPVSVSVTQGSSTLPFTFCDFSGPVSNERADGVVLTQDATEAGVSGGDSSNCLRGDYWGGRSLTCLTLSASSASSDGTTGTAPATVMVSATRFNGNASYSAEVTCVAPPSDSQPSADLEQTCWDRTTKVMATVASRLGVPSDSTTTASSDTLSTLVSLAGSGSGTSTSGTSDQSTPTDTPSDTSTPTDTPTDTPTATPTQDPVAALDQARASSLPNLNLDGHWAVQVASKFNGVTDPTETTASGSHTFGNADILAEYQSLATRFSAYPVMLVKGSDFTTAAGNDRIWVTLVDPGNLPDRAAALTWCSGQFPSLTGNALLNVCYPRQLTPR